MHALLTTLIALTGAGLAGWGFLRALRFRSRARGGGSPRARRLGLWTYAAGGLLLLLPDIVAGAVVAPAAAGSEAGAILGTLAAFVWRCAVLLSIGTGGLVLWLTGRWVTESVTRTIAMVPRPADFAHLRVRQQPGMREFPTEWDALIEHDRTLARRLLGQGSPFDDDRELASLRDYENPVTRSAMEALVECDRVRTPQPPRGTRDVLGSDYGRAVASFEAAVIAAEDHARRRQPR